MNVVESVMQTVEAVEGSRVGLLEGEADGLMLLMRLALCSSLGSTLGRRLGESLG